MIAISKCIFAKCHRVSFSYRVNTFSKRLVQPLSIISSLFFEFILRIWCISFLKIKCFKQIVNFVSEFRIFFNIFNLFCISRYIFFQLLKLRNFIHQFSRIRWRYLFFFFFLTYCFFFIYYFLLSFLFISFFFFFFF